MNKTLGVPLLWASMVWTFATLIANWSPIDDRPYDSVNPLHRWDAGFYESLASHGSTPRQQAFFPLFPAVTESFGRFTGLSFNLSAGILNVAAVLAASLTLGTIGRKRKLPNPNWIMIGLLASPAAFSLLAPYPTAFLVLTATLIWYGIVAEKPIVVGIAAALALLSHPTGIILAVVGLLAIIRSAASTRQKTLAAAVPALTIILLLASGRLASYLAAQFGLTIFDGVPFAELGWWYLTHPDRGWLAIPVIGSLIGLTALTALGLRRHWRVEPWLAISAVGLFLIGVLSGAWPSLPRYLLPALLIPVWLSGLPIRTRWLIVAVGWILQAVWLYGYVSWDIHV